jgi:hypothetical protein
MKRPLLLVPDLTDERILFAHTMRLLEALSAAGKQVLVVAGRCVLAPGS